MKKRLLARLTALALCLSLPAACPPARAAEPRGVVTLHAERQGSELTVTLGVNNVTFNAMQIYVAYDQTRLTPAAPDGAGMTEALQPEYDAIFQPDGWMQADAALDEKNGVVRYLVTADAGAAGGGTLDEEGFVNVDAAGLDLLRMRFTVRDGATLYADSIKLGKSASAPGGIVIATKDEAGIEHADAVLVELGAAAESGLTPGGTGEGWFGGKPEEGAGGSGTGSGGSAGGSASGGSGSGGSAPDNTAQPGGASMLTDITGHWARESIETLVAAGVVNGYEDGTFRPESPLTRGEFAAVLARALGLSATGEASPFADCTGWEAPYVSAVYKAGFVSGTGEGRFSPELNITREELVTILSRTKSLTGGSISGFADAARISDWAAQGVGAAVEAGLVSGYPDGTFRPQSPVTRGEMAKMVVAARG